MGAGGDSVQAALDETTAHAVLVTGMTTAGDVGRGHECDQRRIHPGEIQAGRQPLQQGQIGIAVARIDHHAHLGLCAGAPHQHQVVLDTTLVIEQH